mgnify:CR=1 FL=1
MIPKAQRSVSEDAFFISERGFGIADGVSGWNDYGFSSSAFSTEMMKNCKSELEEFDRRSHSTQKENQ